MDVLRRSSLPVDALVPDILASLQQTSNLVVEAEPGAGKSDLLDFLGKSYEVPRQPASQFVHEAPATKSVLVIDALDEVARIGEEKINEIIVKARASTATRCGRTSGLRASSPSAERRRSSPAKSDSG